MNKTLTNLYLSYNGISDAGATCIAEAIKVNKMLAKFDLSWYCVLLRQLKQGLNNLEVEGHCL